MAEPGQPGRARSRRHHRAHRHRRRHAARTRRRSRRSRRSCARGSKAACSSRTTCASTTDSSGASSPRIGDAVAQPEAVHGAAVARAVSRNAAPQSRRGHGAARYRHREPPSRHARRAGAAGSSGASCARPGPSTRCRPRSICASLRATLPAALSPDLRRRSAGEPWRLSLLRHGETAREHFYMWARRTTCASGCSIISAAGATDAKSREARRAGAARGMDRNRRRARRAAARGA